MAEDDDDLFQDSEALAGIIDELQGKQKAMGRTQGDAPEVDGLVFVTGRKINIGDIVPVEITDTLEYDLIGKKL